MPPGGGTAAEKEGINKEEIPWGGGDQTIRVTKKVKNLPVVSGGETTEPVARLHFQE